MNQKRYWLRGLIFGVVFGILVVGAVWFVTEFIITDHGNVYISPLPLSPLLSWSVFFIDLLYFANGNR